MAQEDAERPRARGLGGGDVELAAGLEGLGAGQPDHLRRRRDGDGGDHAARRRRQRGHQHEREHKDRKGQERVDHPLDGEVELPAHVARNESDGAAQRYGYRHRDDADVERDAGSVDDAAEDVAPQRIRPEKGPARRPLQPGGDVLRHGIVRRDEVGEDGGSGERGEHRHARGSQRLAPRQRPGAG